MFEMHVTFVSHFILVTNLIKKMLGLSSHNDISGYFTAISLYRKLFFFFL